MSRVVLGNLLYPSQTDGDGGYESESVTDIYMGRFGEEKRSAKGKFPFSSSLEKEKSKPYPVHQLYHIITSQGCATY